MMLAFIILAALALAMIIVVSVSTKRTRRLSPSAIARFASMWKSLEQMDDGARQILEADAIVDQALKELGFEGSMGEKLKAAEPRIPNIEALWRAHKLRNRIAHEPGISVSEKEVRVALKAFKKAMNSFY